MWPNKTMRVFIALSLILSCIVTSFSNEQYCIKEEDCLEEANNRYGHLQSEEDFTEQTQKLHRYVHLGVVACGDRLEETLTMIKSALLFARRQIILHIFAGDDLIQQFNDRLRSWKEGTQKVFDFNVYPIQFPSDLGAEEWRNLFKPCASQRLFIPDLLKDVDSLVYVDTDVLFLRPIGDLWKFFKKFNDTQLAGTSPEHEEPIAGWYNRFALHPYVPPYGINSGVMLMNLTRIRSINWLKYIIPYYKEYKHKITWGDQDLINIFFHFHPDKLYQFPCSWNYRPDHCMYMSNCKDAEKHGISILHGSRGMFHTDNMPTFKAIYDAFNEFCFETNSTRTLRDNIISKMKLHENTQCGKVSEIFTKLLFKYLK